MTASGIRALLLQEVWAQLLDNQGEDSTTQLIRQVLRDLDAFLAPLLP